MSTFICICTVFSEGGSLSDIEPVKTGNSGTASDPVLFGGGAIGREGTLFCQGTTDADIAMRQQHSENRMVKTEKTLSSMATMLRSLTETIKQLQGTKHQPISTGKSAASLEPNLLLTLESSDQREGFPSLLPPEPSQSETNNTVVRNRGFKTPLSQKE